MSRAGYRLVVVGVIAAPVVLFGCLFVAAADKGGDRRDAIKACHARGPEFHYWQERDRCVRYLDE